MRFRFDPYGDSKFFGSFQEEHFLATVEDAVQSWIAAGWTYEHPDVGLEDWDAARNECVPPYQVDLAAPKWEDDFVAKPETVITSDFTPPCRNGPQLASRFFAKKTCVKIGKMPFRV